MGKNRYVQHISGQGEKWEVLKECMLDYMVLGIKGANHYLPFSEYRLCEPPEQWEDVSGECNVVQENHKTWKINCGHSALFVDHYLVRKELVQRAGKAGTCYAFIVERKVQ